MAVILVIFIYLIVNQVRLVRAPMASKGNVRIWLFARERVWMVMARLWCPTSRIWLLSRLSQRSRLNELKKFSGRLMIWFPPRKNVVKVFLKNRKLLSCKVTSWFLEVAKMWVSMYITYPTAKDRSLIKLGLDQAVFGTYYNGTRKEMKPIWNLKMASTAF